MQAPVPEVDLYSYRIPGLKAFRSAGDIVFIGRGSRLISVDGQDPSSPQVLDRIMLGGHVRDMEFWGEKLVIAQDAGLAIVDISNPSDLVFEREIWTCGRASAVEVTGNTAWFLTPVGIGSVNLEVEGAVLPDSFGLLLPISWQTWEIIDMDTGFCDDLSYLAQGFLWGPYRGFEASFGWGYAAVHKHLIVIRLDSEELRVMSSLRFDSKIEALRQEGEYIYLNLKDGSRPLVNVRDPADPQVAGEHTVADWTEGMFGVDGRMYKMRNNFIDIASVF